MNIQLINFNILLGLSLTSICPTNDIKKINNNTNIHLDLRQIGCYCIRPITANIVVGLDEYVLNIESVARSAVANWLLVFESVSNWLLLLL